MTWQPTAAECERLLALGREQDLFELILAQVLRHLLLPGEGAVDGGAHRGIHTALMARAVGPAGWVLAVEPLADHARWLRTLLNARTGRPQVTVAELALAAAPGRARFQQVLAEPGYSGLRLRRLDRPSPVAEIEVECVTLDALVGERRGLALVKLDLEGGEFDALRGARRLLARDRPALFFECGRGNAAQLYGYRAEDYFGFFAAAGYRLLDCYGRPFGPAQWNQPDVPYYRAAVPRGSGAEARLPGLLRSLAWAALHRPAELRPAW